MSLLKTIMTYGVAVFLVGGFVYFQYRYARWNWERRNQDMKADVQTLFDGKK